jgi:hypothetical protein
MVLSPQIAAASEGKFSLCRIEYDLHYQADPEHRVDTHKISKQFTACTRDLADCKHRGKSLAHAHENVYRSNPNSGVPDLSTIHVSHVRIEGHCNELQ